MTSVWGELKRRKVVRVAIAYAVAGWLLIQVADIVLDNIEAPAWIFQVILLLLVIGFPLAIIFAWAFELTPTGIKRDADAETASSTSIKDLRKPGLFIGAALIASVSGFLWFNFLDDKELEDKSIAVLPFVNMSADPDNEYFSDGLSDMLLHKLAQISELTVTARTSSFQFKNKNMDARDIGVQLGVAYVLEGSVQKSSNQLRVIAQLIETKTGTHIDSMTFNRALADVFSIQDEIAEGVVNSLRVTLLEGEAGRLGRRETNNVEAYEEYLLGRHLTAEGGFLPGFRTAIDHFLRAQQHDPDFVSPYIGHAMARILIADWGGSDMRSAEQEVSRLLTQIKRLDPNNPDIYLIEGWRSWVNGDKQNADNLFARHLAVSPSSDYGFYWYAYFLQNQLRFQESFQILERGVRLNPLNPRLESVTSWADIGVGNLEAAFERNYRLMEQYPTYTEAIVALSGNEYLSFGNVHNALRWQRQAELAGYPFTEWSAEELLSILDPGASLNLTLRASDKSAPWVRQTRALVALLNDREDDAVMIARDSLFQSYQRTDTVVIFARIARLAYPDDTEAIRQDYERAIPALISGRRFDEQAFYWSSGFAPRTYAMATADYAGLLIRLGEDDKAADYIEDVEYFISKVPRMGFWGYGVLDAEIAAIRGDRDRALNLLEQAVQSGWMELWWFNTKYNPNLVSLHGDPRYEALIQRLTARAKEQQNLYLEYSSNAN
jgi:TolB-like protein